MRHLDQTPVGRVERVRIAVPIGHRYHVRTLVPRLERSTHAPDVVDPHPPGTLHHIYVITGKLRAGPTNDSVDLATGDFVRFPGDMPHLLVRLSDRVVAHMVTTLPQVRQFGPTVTPAAAHRRPARPGPSPAQRR